jgi:hypothetical protein
MATTVALLGREGKRDGSASSRTASRIANASAAAIGSVRRGAASAVVRERRTLVWGPPVAVSRALRRVAGAAEHRAVADVERRTACRERDDVIDGEVGGVVGWTAVAGAPIAMLATPCSEHSDAQALPGTRAVQGVVAAAVRLARVLGAAATRAAGDDTTERAELQRWPCQGAVPFWTLVTLECTPVDIAKSVIGDGGGVYSPRLLRLRSQGHVRVSLPLAFAQPASKCDCSARDRP